MRNPGDPPRPIRMRWVGCPPPPPQNRQRESHEREAPDRDCGGPRNTTLSRPAVSIRCGGRPPFGSDLPPQKNKFAEHPREKAIDRRANIRVDREMGGAEADQPAIHEWFSFPAFVPAVVAQPARRRTVCRAVPENRGRAATRNVIADRYPPPYKTTLHRHRIH